MSIFKTTIERLKEAKQKRIQRKNIGSNEEYSKIITSEYELKNRNSGTDEFPLLWDAERSPKCHLCGIQVKDIEGEICDDCLTNVSKRLFMENEKLNEEEYKNEREDK